MPRTEDTNTHKATVKMEADNVQCFAENKAHRLNITKRLQNITK